MIWSMCGTPGSLSQESSLYSCIYTGWPRYCSERCLDVQKMYITTKASFSRIRVHWTKTFWGQLIFLRIIFEGVVSEHAAFSVSFFSLSVSKSSQSCGTNSQVSVVDRKSMVWKKRLIMCNPEWEEQVFINKSALKKKYEQYFLHGISSICYSYRT